MHRYIVWLRNKTHLKFSLNQTLLLLLMVIIMAITLSGRYSWIFKITSSTANYNFINKLFIVSYPSKLEKNTSYKNITSGTKLNELFLGRGGCFICLIFFLITFCWCFAVIVIFISASQGSLCLYFLMYELPALYGDYIVR